MEQRGLFTWDEIFTQPEAWSSALQLFSRQRRNIEDFFLDGKYSQVIFTGCGSTYYLSIAAAALFQELSGFPARAFPASELWLYPETSYAGKGRSLLIATSRSGETTETLRACEIFLNQGRGDLLTLSCYIDKPLAKMGVLNLVFPSGGENSVAQTRAFTTLYLVTVALATLWAKRADLYDDLSVLPSVGRRILTDYAGLAKELGKDEKIDRFYFLGSGARYGLACELNLKMKEMSLTHSEPFYFFEFRHGPKSMVTNSTSIIGLLSSSNSELERAVLKDMRLLGGKVIEIGESGQDVAFSSNLNEAIRNVLYLPFGQMMAYERSMSKGLNPDRPHNLDTVVILGS